MHLNPHEKEAPPGLVTDADLVAACLAGERDAFARIVERYQRLLCSLAYAATGSVSESEDVAQETFIAAWGQLPALREPEKLRPWLCGILRHKVGRFRRRFRRDAVFGAESVEAADHVATTELSIADKTMHEEEHATSCGAHSRRCPNSIASRWCSTIARTGPSSTSRARSISARTP